MVLTELEKIILWLLVDADKCSDHGFEMSVLHDELERRNLPDYKNFLRELKKKDLVLVDRSNDHHKAMYKLLPLGWEALGLHKPEESGENIHAPRSFAGF